MDREDIPLPASHSLPATRPGIGWMVANAYNVFI
jgi:hypothetical protein